MYTTRFMAKGPDARRWVPTDRPGEWVTVGEPVAGIEVLSARGSTRHWCEQMHEAFTVAAIHDGPAPTAAEWRTRGRSWTTAGGQLMSINAGDGHSTVRVHAPSAFDAVKFAPQWMEFAARGIGPRAAFRFRSPACANAIAYGAIRRLVDTIAGDESPFVIEAACHETAYTLLSELGEATTRSFEGLDPVRDFRLRRVREYLFDHSCDRPSLDVLERDTGLGKSQLCASFKKAYGVSIGQYWTGCRVTKAKTLLLKGVPAKYVAVDLGFTDEAYFSRVFRRHNGLPPVAWVSLYRSNTRTPGSRTANGDR